MLRILLPALLLVALAAPAASALELALPGMDVAVEEDVTRAPPALVAPPRVVDDLVVAIPFHDPRVLVDELPLVADSVARAPIAVSPDATPPAFVPAPPIPSIGDAPPVATAAAGTTILWLLFERLGIGRALMGTFAALYFRVQPNELLENERREKVVQLVRERPGIGPQDVASALGTGWGVTSYHLDRLERAGLVTSQRVGHHRCYFVPGAVRRDDQRTVGLVRGDTARRVAALVNERPGLTQSELASALGLSASAASKQVAKLVEAGLLRRESSSAGQRLFAQPTLGSVLAPAPVAC